MKLLVPPLLCLAFFRRVQAVIQCTLAEPITLHDKDDRLTLEQVANPEAGTFTMRLTYYGGQSWIGIGINQRGRNKMTPATAVIGRILDGAPSVLKYNLESDDKDASGVREMDTALQNLRDTRFTQTDSESVLEFTQELNDVTQLVEDDSVWIYAVGLPDNEWEGKHNVHGAFTITLDQNCVDIPSPTNPKETSPPATVTNPPATATPAGPTATEPPEGTNLFQSESSSDEGGTDSSGNPDEGGTDSSGNPESSTNSANSGITKVQDPTEETRPLWIAHGFLMAIAWGICAPIAIGAVLLRHVSFLAANGCWYRIHFYLNIANFLFTIIGFSLALAATNQENDEHFENTHQKAGLAIFVIVCFQFAVAAFLRPPTSSPPQDKSSLSHGLEQAVTNDSETGSSAEAEIEEDTVTHEEQPTKSKPRLAWEISHRLMGVTLIGLAWYNCDSGIDLQVEKYDESDDLTNVFWSITGGIAGLIFCLAYVVRI